MSKWGSQVITEDQPILISISKIFVQSERNLQEELLRKDLYENTPLRKDLHKITVQYVAKF
ncbi:hypothetical protein Avbf_18319 [Armadillidium vulgare]|nr:hypothetical protein Avbf_18319 [Armadillidium vulgare]